MKMPGFTAEASLYQSGQQFTMAGASGAATKGAAVVPQACVNIGPCRVCVDFRPFPPKVCVSVRCPLGIGFSRCVP